eukprot:scaffold24337_cov82-Cyclotella_meneghiniana.AAC.8
MLTDQPETGGRRVATADGMSSMEELKVAVSGFWIEFSFGSGSESVRRSFNSWCLCFVHLGANPFAAEKKFSYSPRDIAPNIKPTY